MFSGTISDNIRYGMMDATEDELMAAMNWPKQIILFPLYHRGQCAAQRGGKQSLLGQKHATIARAVLHDPKILIFDEATSSVDTRRNS